MPLLWTHAETPGREQDGPLPAGLLRISKGGKPPFQVLKKALGLMVDGVDPKDPTDPAYVFSGYAPISVRLTQAALRCAHLSAIVFTDAEPVAPFVKRLSELAAGR